MNIFRLASVVADICYTSDDFPVKGQGKE